MLNKLISFIREYNMISGGDTVVCAVSGGADSMALLMAMYLLRSKLSINLEAVHFNHKLRGAESDADEQFVREFCCRYEIPLHVGSASVEAGKKGLEAAARDARYAYFESLSGKIATAHTADDNAETVLMHMVRGTGLKGLGGIAPVRKHVIRPMLSVTRQEVLAFLKEYHVRFVEDSSNAADQFLRNRLRHHVMPLLKAENPRLAENLSAMALRLREDEQALSQPDSAKDCLSVTQLRTLPKARRSRVLSAFLENCGVREPEAEHIALAESLVFSEKPSAKACFPGGVTVCREYDTLKAAKQTQSLSEYVLHVPGVTELPELGLWVVCEESDCRDVPNAFCIRPVGTVVVRSRRSGDAIRLKGGTKSLKKLFIDKKIPASERCRVPVLCDDEGIFGVYGIGMDVDRQVQTGPCIQIRFEKM